MKERQRDFLKLCLADALLRLMQEQDFDEINVSAVCTTAGIGRTTFYRYFAGKHAKEEVLIFKLLHEWKLYRDKHEDDVKADHGYAIACYVYENRKVFLLLERQRLTGVLIEAFEQLMMQGETVSADDSYLTAFFTCGFFGIMYRWIRRGFDETPEQVRAHIANTLMTAASRAQG